MTVRKGSKQPGSTSLLKLKASIELQYTAYNSSHHISFMFLVFRIQRKKWCWWRMLETKCAGDNYKMLVTVKGILVTNIHYLFTLASGTKIQKRSRTTKFYNQYPKMVKHFMSPTSRYHRNPDVANITFITFQSKCLLLKLMLVFKSLKLGV